MQGAAVSVRPLRSGAAGWNRTTQQHIIPVSTGFELFFFCNPPFFDGQRLLKLRPICWQ